MQFALGVLLTLTICLAIALALVWKKFSVLNQNIDGLYGEIRKVHATILNLPPTMQNVIHLDLKDAKMDVGLEPVTLPIQPEDFKIKSEKLREKLLNGFVTKAHPDTETRAFCILEHAGMGAYVANESRRSIQSALTRLLLNGDDEAVKRFLELVADSISGIKVATETAL